ncbi:MAG TPA: D-alanine--D-alanine ligase family protein [Actinomycetota bacterium]|jgi:D-alanine-D-alanine ligase
MQRLRVGVIFGGRSVEHDVSIVTAHQVMAALGARHEVVPIYVTKEGRWLAGPRLNDLAVYKAGTWDDAGEPAHIAPVYGTGGVSVAGGRLRGARTVPLDAVVPAIHGTFGEDGTLQGLLELAGLPYTGSRVVGSAVGMDKVAMKRAFRDAGLPVVGDVVVEAARLDDDAHAVYDRIETALGYPVFVKPSRLGSSVGIGKADDRDQLVTALDVARRYDRRLVVEESKGECIEVNCSVLGGSGRPPQVSVCEQPVRWQDFLSFENKYLAGSKSGKGGGMADQERRIPAPISDELTKQVQDNALTAFEAVDAAGVARVDAFVDESTGETWVMEINTIPGSFSFYLWEKSGMSFEDLLDAMLEIALTAQRERSELMFSFDSKLLEASPGVKTRG